jgi:hypothetical protein
MEGHVMVGMELVFREQVLDSIEIYLHILKIGISM